MPMTKQDFAAIAATLAVYTADNSQNDEAVRECAAAIACDLADWLAASNPRFDRARFLAACGVQP